MYKRQSLECAAQTEYDKLAAEREEKQRALSDVINPEEGAEIDYQRMAELKGYADDFALLQKVEELGLPMVMERKHSDTPMCANVDMYSGLVYAMLGIPEEVFTPLFASARIAGWCANRIEEVVTCHRIMRPAYRAVTTHEAYIPMDQRGEHLHLSAAD